VVDYVALHVLTCLVPAFLLAGAMVTFVNREAILDHLGEAANKAKSFSLASASSFFVAACSCTVIPVASGLYFSGAGIGVAFIVLWVAPASNILSLIYTGNILGPQIVLARIVAALAMAMAIGWVMSAAFRREQTASPAAPARRPRIVGGRELGLLALILLSLLLPNYVGRTGPFSQKVIIWAVATGGAAAYAFWALPVTRLKDWMRETWFFVKTIFPLLIAGVFIVGVVGKVLPEDWIRRWLGGNGLTASFLATVIGALSYFATMTEAPFVHTLMRLGMGKGPALALLLTGPGASLPNFLAIAKVFGVKKALVYAPTMIVLGTLVGWVFGKLA
jgi:uncharacterized membrane protein YraQ (UPF0718 family)